MYGYDTPFTQRVFNDVQKRKYAPQQLDLSFLEQMLGQIPQPTPSPFTQAFFQRNGPVPDPGVMQQVMIRRLDELIHSPTSRGQTLDVDELPPRQWLQRDIYPQRR